MHIIHSFIIHIGVMVDFIVHIVVVGDFIVHIVVIRGFIVHIVVEVVFNLSMSKENLHQQNNSLMFDYFQNLFHQTIIVSIK